MGEVESNNSVDDDIMECKGDILRASDIIPGGKAAKTAQDARPAIREIKDGGDGSGGLKVAENDIPRFDLAEEILSAQRKVSALKRAGPGGRKSTAGKEKRVEPVRAVSRQRSKWPLERERDSLIAEIVSRDIGKLCRRSSRH